MKKILVLLIGLTLLASCGDDNNDQPGTATPTQKNVNANPALRPEYRRLEMPHIKGSKTDLVVVHSTSEYGVNYILEWDCQKKSQRWSCYTLDRRNSPKNVNRWDADKGESQYPYDPDIPSAYIFAYDPYWGTGFDHGHICPSYDRLNSREANIQTFYLSNMQPQRNSFNAGIWLKMENMVGKTWNTNQFRDTLYICKGGTIDKSDQILTTLSSGLIVPKYFFMAILCKNSQGYKALGFWVEQSNDNITNNQRANDNIINYVVSIDELERLTGIDFFCNLPDDVEEAAEKIVFPVSWGLRN